MKYVHLNAEERSAIATLKRLGWERAGNGQGAWTTSEHGGAGDQAQRDPA